MKKLFFLAALACVGAAHANLIVNGDFESGLTGFTSDYTLSSDLRPEGDYNVGTDPHDFHPSWSSFGDHTTGTGNMLIANGGGDVSNRVWQGDAVALAAGTYVFSFYGASVYSGNSANLSLALGSSPLGTTGLFSTTPGEWNKYSFQFSTAGGPSTFALRDTVTVAGGNDFAIDDIKLEAVPEPTSMAALGLGALAMLRRRKRA